MDLNKVYENIKDKKEILFRKYYESISKIYNSSDRGVIVKPISGGLSRTPTNDSINN